MEEKKIGEIAHYFGKIGVGVIKLTDDTLSVGDTIHIKGHTTDFEQKIESMQIEHEDVQTAKVGDSVGTKVKEPVRDKDIVYKVTE